MGGYGSGRWYRFVSKSTVDESLTLAMRDIRGRIRPGLWGELTWTWSDGNQSSIGYFVTWGDRPTITLHYRWDESDDVQIPIQLATSPTQFGGSRWWFTCPLVVSGVPCQRRAGKLHLPPGAQYFGCRKCHDLSYRSSQEAHQMDRLFRRLAADN